MQIKINRRIRNNKKGFTLIEVLVVIGIIAILAAIVLVAVNPARQFKLARDTQRTSNVNAILNAIGQNMSENKGLFTCAGQPVILPFDSTTTIANDTSYGVDIAPCIVPDYISSMPYDPNVVGANYVSTSSYDTKYGLFQDTNGRITISANGEITPIISVTR